MKKSIMITAMSALLSLGASQVIANTAPIQLASGSMLQKHAPNQGVNQELRKSKQQEHREQAQKMRQMKAKGIVGGVFIKAENEGTGPRPGRDDTITIKYTGKLLDGTVFDRTEGDATATVKIDDVIQGLGNALSHMRSGQKATVYIPFWQAYRARGKGKIGPFENLIFDIEVVKIERAQ